MKTLNNLFAIAALIMASACSSTYHPGSTAADDVYYTPKDKPATVATPAPAAVADNYSNENSNYNQDNSGQTQQYENTGNFTAK